MEAQAGGMVTSRGCQGWSGSRETGRGEEGFFPRASQRSGCGPADIWVLDF